MNAKGSCGSGATWSCLHVLLGHHAATAWLTYNAKITKRCFGRCPAKRLTWIHMPGIYLVHSLFWILLLLLCFFLLFFDCCLFFGFFGLCFFFADVGSCFLFVLLSFWFKFCSDFFVSFLFVLFLCFCPFLNFLILYTYKVCLRGYGTGRLRLASCRVLRLALFSVFFSPGLSLVFSEFAALRKGGTTRNQACGVPIYYSGCCYQTATQYN